MVRSAQISISLASRPSPWRVLFLLVVVAGLAAILNAAPRVRGNSAPGDAPTTPAATPPAAAPAVPTPPATNLGGFKPIDNALGQEGVAKQLDEANADNTCRVTFCTESLSKVLVHDSKGKLIAQARSLTIHVDRIGEKPIVKCQLFEGTFPPTTPAVKTWRLAEMRFVSPKEFQNLVDKGAADKPDDPVVSQPAGTPAGVDLRGVTPLIPPVKE